MKESIPRGFITKFEFTVGFLAVLSYYIRTESILQAALKKTDFARLKALIALQLRLSFF
jgi:hypothetical protein